MFPTLCTQPYNQDDHLSVLYFRFIVWLFQAGQLKMSKTQCLLGDRCHVCKKVDLLL